MVFGHKPAINRTLTSILIAAVAAAPGSTPAHAATVKLNNGDQITGELLQLSGGSLTFKSAIFGKVKIPWNQVGKLTSDQGIRVQLNDGTVLKGKLVLDEAGNVAVDEGRAGHVRQLLRRDIAALNPAIVDNSVKYSGLLNVGGSLNHGNSDEKQLNVNGQLIARTRQHRYTVGVEVNEARSGGVKTTSNRRLNAQYDAFLSEKNFMFVNAKAESDELADLKLRTSLGAGYGRQFIDNDISSLAGQVGLSYVNEDHDISADRSFPSLSLGLKYDRKFFENKLVYFQNINIDSSLQETKNVLVRNRLGFRMPVADGITLSPQLNVDYDNQPPVGTKKTDSALIFSVGYGF